MFENMKMLGALAGIMKNKDRLKEAGERVRAKMEATRVSGEAGSGAARATVTGAMRVLEIELSAALVVGMAGDPRTHALASGLIAEAVNSALAEAQRKLKESLDEEARGLGLDGMPDLPGFAGLGA